MASAPLGGPAGSLRCPHNVPYCSLRCYRAHGSCAEEFYRDQVLGELRRCGASPSRLATALRRLRQRRETEDEPGDAGLRPGPAPGGLSGLWERLAPAKVAFERLLSRRRGRGGCCLRRPWWWGAGAGPRLLEELGDAPSGDAEELEPSSARMPPEPVRDEPAAVEPVLETSPGPALPPCPPGSPRWPAEQGPDVAACALPATNVLLPTRTLWPCITAAATGAARILCHTARRFRSPGLPAGLPYSAEEALQAAAHVCWKQASIPGPLGTREPCASCPHSAG